MGKNPGGLAGLSGVEQQHTKSLAGSVVTPLSGAGKAALAYAAIGWPVLPTYPSKASRVPGGWASASTDPDQIEAWWREWPNACVAVAPGLRAGFFAVDVDEKNGKDGLTTLAELEDLYGWLPPTVEARTKSGGRHLLFRAPPGALDPARVRSDRVCFAPGLDFRAEKDLLTVWPTPGYDWITSPFDLPPAEAPQWLLDLLAEAPEEKPAKPAKGAAPDKRTKLGSHDRATRYVAKVVSSECDAIAAMKPNTGRARTLYGASIRLGRLVAGDALPEHTATTALHDAAKACGLIRDDGAKAVARTITNGLREGFKAPRAVEFPEVKTEEARHA